MKPLDITLLIVNAIGIVLYLLLASRGWRIPQEHGMVPVAGEPFVWALAVPVFGVFLLADIAWGGVILRDTKSERKLWWFLTAAAWLIAICVDFVHH